ncbi:MAG: hypothetical protein ABIH92_04400 [Nanoarchaeota archaeon]
MPEDKIKEAFQKVKEDILNLQSDLSSISREIQEIKRTLIQTDRPTDIQTDTRTASFQELNEQTHFQTRQTNTPIQTDTQTVPQEIGGSESKNSGISTGNRGVQTDRQTSRQTDRQIEKFALSQISRDPITKIERVTEIINSLDSLKKDLRRQFKQLTPQEMLVFSTIYQLTDQTIDVDYSILSKKTNLSESSIRDYVQKIIKKSIPLEKTKEKNKRILLTISPEFKRIASLDTLISLRNL